MAPKSITTMNGPGYTCYRTPGPITIDGDLAKDVWAATPCTPRFGDLATGQVTLLDTRAALRWDATHWYVAFWLEERDVWSTGERPVGLGWADNTVQVCIAGAGAYYHLSVNPLGETSELFFIWKEAYTRGGRYDVPEFDLAVHRPMVLGGDGGPHHPRGGRWAFYHWRFPGLQTAVRVDGSLNQRQDLDQGWTAEIAFPWAGLQPLADGPVPPAEGAVWRILLARQEVIDQRASRHTALWTWPSLGEGTLHTPDQYPEVKFATETG